MTAYIVYNPHGGTEGHSQGYATNLCVGLANNGVSVHLVTSRDFDAADVTAKGVELSYTDIADSHKTTVRYDSWVSKLRYGAFRIYRGGSRMVLRSDHPDVRRYVLRGFQFLHSHGLAIGWGFAVDRTCTSQCQTS